jgi:predicted dehydrogenase
VHVTTPNHLHHPQVAAVLAAGKHVVCEKPLGMTPAESADLLERARASGLVHAVNFNLRFYPLIHEIRARVRGGELGDVWNVHGRYLQDWLLYPTDWNWRLEPEVGGALRAIADIGSHWLDLAAFVTGARVEEVMADLATFLPVRRRPRGPVETFAGAADDGDRVDQEMATEDAAHVLLRFANGARGALSVSQTSAGRKNHVQLEVDGSASALWWCSERQEELWIGHRDAPNEMLFRDPSLMHPDARPVTQLPGGHAEGFPDTFRELYRAVYRAVAAGRPGTSDDYPTFEDGHEENVVCDAIARSARERRWVRIDRAGA